MMTFGYAIVATACALGAVGYTVLFIGYLTR
jgi:hypothetical protein